MARGDAELAAVMRRLLADDNTWTNLDRGVVHYRFALDSTITITEQEMAVIQEVLDAR
jgi:hypothetical protein